MGVEWNRDMIGRKGIMSPQCALIYQASYQFDHSDDPIVHKTNNLSFPSNCCVHRCGIGMAFAPCTGHRELIMIRLRLHW